MSLEGNRWGRLHPSNSCPDNQLPDLMCYHRDSGWGGGVWLSYLMLLSLHVERVKRDTIQLLLYYNGCGSLIPLSLSWAGIIHLTPNRRGCRGWQQFDQSETCRPVTSACVNCQDWVASAVCIYYCICVWVLIYLKQSFQRAGIARLVKPLVTCEVVTMKHL